VVAAAVLSAGAGAVAQVLERLHLSGLLLLSSLHVPIVVLMGLAWWLAAGEDAPASLARFVWARLVRDAAADLLPVFQLGGVMVGVHVLGGRLVAAAVSAGVDGVIELTAKLPYACAALLMLISLQAHARITRLVWTVFVATGLAVAALVLTHRSLSRALAAGVRALGTRWPQVVTMVGGGAEADVQACLARLLGRPAHLAGCFLLHLGCWCLGAAELWVTLRLLGVQVTWAQALVIDGTVATLRTFGVFVPGAAGIQEGGYVLAGALFGIAPAAAIAASLARRARDLLLGVSTLGVAVVRNAFVGNVALGATATRSLKVPRH
jgi:putative membrane protein